MFQQLKLKKMVIAHKAVEIVQAVLVDLTAVVAVHLVQVVVVTVQTDKKNHLSNHFWAEFDILC